MIKRLNLQPADRMNLHWKVLSWLNWQPQAPKVYFGLYFALMTRTCLSHMSFPGAPSEWNCGALHPAVCPADGDGQRGQARRDQREVQRDGEDGDVPPGLPQPGGAETPSGLRQSLTIWGKLTLFWPAQCTHRLIVISSTIWQNIKKRQMSAVTSGVGVMGRKDIFYSGSLYNIPEFKWVWSKI